MTSHPRKWVGLAACGLLAFAAGTYAATTAKPKVFEGIISILNPDGSFVLRLRDGSTLPVKAPLETNMFVSVKGINEGGMLTGVSEIRVKDPNGADAIPVLSVVDPGAAQVGTKITLTGRNFSKRTNSIAIGGVKNALTNVPSKDGKTLAFALPAAPCDQKAKVNCPQTVLPSGMYDLSVSNEHGVSNKMALNVLPLPPLTLTTDMLPQVVAGTRYRMALEATGGAAGYSWRVSDGSLPPGIMLAQAKCTDTPCKSAGIVSGLPTVPGTYDFTVTLVSGNENISREFTIVVVPRM